MHLLDDDTIARLRAFAHRLVDPLRARVAIAPEHPQKGFWFGGGNTARGPDGRLYLCGRYRSTGDSRTGLDLGDRGKELAIFASADEAGTWTKVASLDKAAVSPGERPALSIEGSALRFHAGGVELYVSSEKAMQYPEPVAEYRKPGTGVWTIERLAAETVEGLSKASPHTVMSSHDPATLQIKDPFFGSDTDGSTLLFFCHHSFNWSSSGTGYVRLDRRGARAGTPVFDCHPRGPAWDVAITRSTCILPLPATIAPAGTGLVFYDGGECLRNLDEHAKAKRRPRGYSCEELGGLAYYTRGDPTTCTRISTIFPEFISPDGTGCLRYVDVMATEDAFIATWQQSRPDGSQALMINRVPVA